VNRIDLINTFIRARNYTRYLEIGCAGDTSFHGVSCEEKVGVDPARGGTLRMTSDEFFALVIFSGLSIIGAPLLRDVLRSVPRARAAHLLLAAILLAACGWL